MRVGVKWKRTGSLDSPTIHDIVCTNGEAVGMYTQRGDRPSG